MLVGGAWLCAQAPPAWPDTPAARLQALALIQTLNAEILGSPSATATLERWCRDHRLADVPKIVATPVKGTPRVATTEQRKRLMVGDADVLQYRHVQLRCGDRVLSEAHNWYVPARLSAGMNRLLETTDTPFGKVVEALQPYRRTFAVNLLWAPLPEGWETAATGAMPAPAIAPLSIPDALFEHRAVTLHARSSAIFRSR